MMHPPFPTHKLTFIYLFFYYILYIHGACFFQRGEQQLKTLTFLLDHLQMWLNITINYHCMFNFVIFLDLCLSSVSQFLMVNCAE